MMLISDYTHPFVVIIIFSCGKTLFPVKAEMTVSLNV